MDLGVNLMQFAKSVLLVLPALSHVHAEYPAHFDFSEGFSHLEEVVPISNSSLAGLAEPHKPITMESEDSFVPKTSSKVSLYGQDVANIATNCAFEDGEKCLNSITQSSISKDVSSVVDRVIPVQTVITHIQDGANAVVRFLDLDREDSLASKALSRTMPYGQDALLIIGRCGSGNPAQCAGSIAGSNVLSDFAPVPVKAVLPHAQDLAHAVDKCFYTGTSADCAKAVLNSNLFESAQTYIASNFPKALNAKPYMSDLSEVANKCFSLPDKAQVALEQHLLTAKSALISEISKLSSQIKEMKLRGIQGEELIREEESLKTLIQSQRYVEEQIVNNKPVQSPFKQASHCANAVVNTQFAKDMLATAGDDVIPTVTNGTKALLDGYGIYNSCVKQGNPINCVATIIRSDSVQNAYQGLKAE
jgi:hypothetical protein